MNFGKNRHYLLELVASQTRLLLHKVHAQHHANLQSMVKVVVAPASERAVIVKTKCAKGALVLSPMSTAISCTKRIPDSAMDLGSADGKGTCIVASFCVKVVRNDEGVPDPEHEFIAPFWCVGDTLVAKDASYKGTSMIAHALRMIAHALRMHVLGF